MKECKEFKKFFSTITLKNRFMKPNKQFLRFIGLIVFSCMIFGLLSQIVIAASTANDTGNHGYLKVDGRKFKFDDGTPFIPVGPCFTGPEYYDNQAAFQTAWGISVGQFLDTLAANGINWVRVQSWDWPEYNNQDTWRRNLGWFLSECQNRGIYVMIAVFCPESGKNEYYPPVGYLAKNGGPLATWNDFVTNSAAKAKFKERLAFFNEFTNYRSFASWGIVNEWDCGLPFTGDMVTWFTEMRDYIKSIDTYHHPITTNLSWYDRITTPYFVEISALMDFISVHPYVSSDANAQIKDYRDNQFPPMWYLGKPIIVAEYNDYSNGTPINYVRKGAWIGAVTFSALMEWSGIINGRHLDTRVSTTNDIQNFFSEYAAAHKCVRNFINQTIYPDWNMWTDIQIWKSNIIGAGEIAAMATGTKDKVCAYIYNSSGSYTVNNLSNKTYTIQWFSETTGDVISTEEKTGSSINITSPGGNVGLYIATPIPITPPIVTPTTPLLVTPFPNPCKVSSAVDGKVKFLLSNVDSNTAVTLTLYDSEGTKVTVKTREGSLLYVYWDLKDEGQKIVAQGVYYYEALDSLGRKAKGKIAIIK